MKRALFVLCLALAMAAPTQGGAQSNPVTEQYRIYRAALAANDLEAAERAAEAALAASEARDGDGGSTAVLAMNLALLRLQKGDRAEALAPARRARALAEAQASANVDVELARLTVLRAEYAINPQEGAEPLLQQLRAYGARPGAAAEAYPAAVELGLQAFADQQYDLSAQGWTLAETFGREIGPFARGRAKIGQGAAFIMQEIGPRGRRLTRARMNDAYMALREASEILGPLANEQSPTGDFTLAQRAYAESLAWRRALRARLQADGSIDLDEAWDAEGDAADGLTETQVPAADARPRCLVSIQPARQIRYPGGALPGSIGAVVVWVTIDDTGNVARTGIAAAVGHESLVHAVERVSDSWEVERREDSAPNCRMNMTVLRTVIFMFG